MSEHLDTIRKKAERIRVRNINLERIVSGLHGPVQPGDSILIREVDPQTHLEEWQMAMTLLAAQFADIQELIGMTK